MHLREILKKTGITERQARYLIAEGFVPPPRGGRSNADYGDDHVEAINRYQRLRDLGFPPAAIKLMLESGEGVPFPVAPGVSLVVSPHLLGSGSDPAPLIRAVSSLLTKALKDSPK
jgi:MerR family copper efflux transcriptional regulator